MMPVCSLEHLMPAVIAAGTIVSEMTGAINVKWMILMNCIAGQQFIKCEFQKSPMSSGFVINVYFIIHLLYNAILVGLVGLEPTTQRL